MKKRNEYLPDGIRMIRFDVARLDQRFAVPASGWSRLALCSCYTVAVLLALVLIRCIVGSGS